MALVDLVMPKLGESIMEATILKWHKKPGDAVQEDETVLDIATDKVDSEIPSTVQGVIEEILYQENDVVPIGAVIATIRVGASITTNYNNSPDSDKPIYEDIQIVEEIPFQPTSNNDQINQSPKNASLRFYSPLVINIAQQEGVSMAELENIAGTGQDGRVSKKDILAFVLDKRNNVSTVKTDLQQPEITQHEILSTPTNENINQVAISNGYSSNVEIIEMDRMRKLIAKHMVDSRHTSAHVTSFVECDVTNLVLWRERIKKEFENREGERITYTPLFIEAIVKSIKKYPLLSSSIEGDKIIIKKILTLEWLLPCPMAI